MPTRRLTTPNLKHCLTRWQRRKRGLALNAQSRSKSSTSGGGPRKTLPVRGEHDISGRNEKSPIRLLSCIILLLFFRVKRKVTRRRLTAMPDKKKTPIRSGPAGCPALLGKGALSTTRCAQTRTSLLRPFLRCSAPLKGESKPINHSQPSLRGLHDANRSAGGKTLCLILYSPLFSAFGITDALNQRNKT